MEDETTELVEPFPLIFDEQDGKNDQDNDTEVGSKPIRRKRLLKKAPDAPKRFKSAYICFVTERMDDVKKSLPPDVKVSEMQAFPRFNYSHEDWRNI
jgi:hypothetical protein